GTVTDNSKYHVTVHATYNSNSISAVGINTDQVTFSDTLTRGTKKLTLLATDAFGNSDVATLTFIATKDVTPPTVTFLASPAIYKNANWAASPTIVASYNAHDNVGGSGLLNNQVKFYLKSKGGTTASFTTPGGTVITNNNNLISYFKQIGIVNKGATDVTLTIAATDNVGNKTVESTTWTVNLTFSIINPTVNSNGQLVIPFNTPANGTLPASSDVYLSIAIGKFTAYNFNYTPGATALVVSTVQQNGSVISVGALPTGTYKLYVSGVYTVNGIPLSNGNGTESFTMPINTVTPPTLSVTPTSTVINGKVGNVTFRVNATSAAGIKEVVGSFNGQTKYLYGSTGSIILTGSMTFAAPTVTTGTYTATFTAQDESVNQNKTTVTALVYVNAVAPTLTLTAPATVDSGKTFTATVAAYVGNTLGNNVIKSVVIYQGTTKLASAVQSATNPASWTASVSLTGNGVETLTAVATDLYGNSASTSKNVYVDGQAPTITVILTGRTGLTSSPYTLTNGSSVTVYTSSTSGLSGTVTVTDNSKMPVTAIATERTTTSTELTFTTISGPASQATFKATGTIGSSKQYTIKASSTDAFGHQTTYVATFTLIVDPNGPTVAATVSTTPLSTTSTYASVTYKAFDNVSGIVGNEATLTIKSKVVTSPVVLYVSTTSASKTINVLTNLLGSGFAGKSGSATVTVTAKSNSGVVNSTTNAGTVIKFDFTFKITDVTRSMTASGSPVVITFNTVAKANSSFVPSNVYFVNASGVTYDASAIIAPTGTTKIATITQFSMNGTLVKSANMQIGSYIVYVNNIVGATPTTDNAQVANSPYPATLP
ncbi:MAG: Ig-like domain-containing protein, partial [Candidatus Micrarchaeaceae archaeon]